MKRRRPPLHAGHRLFCFLLTWVPPLVLLLLAGRAVVNRLDAVLAQASPLAAAEASRALGREVRIGALSPDLTARRLWTLLTRRPLAGTLPVVVTDLAIANERTLEEAGALATARRATGELSLARLLIGDLARAFPRITIEAPDILLVRRGNGRFNVQDLVRPRTGPPGKPFRTVLTVQDGRLTFRDFAARLPAGRRPAVNRLADLDGTFDLSGTRTIRFDASARAAPDTPTASRLGGRVRSSGAIPRGTPAETAGAPRALVAVNAADADAAYWFDYLFDIASFRVGAGRADVDARFALQRASTPEAAPPPVQFVGTARVRGVRVFAQALRTPLYGVAGELRFDRNVLRINGTGSLLGGPATASGSVWNYAPLTDRDRAAGPQVALSVDLPRVRTERVVRTYFPAGLPQGVSVRGLASFTGSVQGPTRRLVVIGRARIPEVGYRGQRASNVSTSVAYAGGLFTLSDVTGRLAGGAVTGRAVLRTGVPAAAAEGGAGGAARGRNGIATAFEVAVSGANLNELRLPGVAPSSLTGRGDVAAVGKIVGGRVEAAANVQTQGVTFRGIALSQARARVVVVNNRVVVPALVATSSAGAVRVRGDVSPRGDLDLAVNAVGIDLRRIARALGRRDLEGTAYASGRVNGTLQAPVLTAQVRVLAPGYGAYRADLVSGTLRATRTRIALGDDVVVRRFPASARVTGAIALRPQSPPRLDLVVQARSLQIGELLRQAGQKETVPPQVAGVVETATLRVTGTTADPRLVGSAQVNSLVAGGYAIDQGRISFQYADRLVTITEARLQDPRIGALTARARVLPNGQLVGSFSAPNLNLATLSPLTRRFATLGGTVSLSGDVSGTRTRPVLDARITSPEVTVSGTALRDISASVRYVANTRTGDSRLTMPRLTFRQNGTGVQVAGASYDRRSGRVGGTLSLRTGDIAVLLDTLRRSGLAYTEQGAGIVNALNRLPQPISGGFAVRSLFVGGRVTPEGFVDRTVRANLSGTDVRIGQFQADSAALVGSLERDVLTLEQFTFKNDATDTTILARGTADLGTGGEINAVLESSNASLTLVRAFAPSARVEGRADLFIRATGRTETPTVTASLEGRNVAVGDVTLSLLRVPAVVLRPTPAAGEKAGEIEISEIRFLSGDHAATITGRLPFSYAGFNVPDDRPIRVQASVREQSLDLITVFAPGVPPEAIGGTVTAELDARGTRKAPLLSGFLRVVDGSFRMPREEGQGRDRINPVADLDVNLVFDGSRITFEQFALALGGPNGQRGDFGRMDVSGSVDLSGLEFLPRVNAEGLPASRVAEGGALNLAITLTDLRPVAEDLFVNRGEVLRGRINGGFRVTGSLAAPLLTTQGGAPLLVSDGYVQLPTRPEVPGGRARSLAVNPRFALDFAIDRRAALVGPGSYRLEADGEARVGGRLDGLDMRAELIVQSGFFQFPNRSARFQFVRGGRVFVTFNPPEETVVRADDLEARATVYVPRGISLSPAGFRERGAGTQISAAPPTTGRGQRYRITAAINGNLLAAANLEPAALDLDSDPPLERNQILSLLLNEQQLALVAQGNVDRALQLAFTQALTSSLVPTLFSPIEQSVSSALGLEEFALEYNPDAPLTLRFLKRFPDPFERFLVGYTRTLSAFGGRSEPGRPQPYELSLYYELGTRLQIGITADEERDVLTFLRGSLSF
uniref:Translocation and assembly module TamB C-terminal domain-containing protein n=1 Tax=uncultured Armatimonadetes bacterium TaxID=157466 RepID=A0A6J4IYV4_9BACT|nr:hypothetical protein AVDCRST_MAG63-2681 [uncultured Armatimonadetes bacterium]